LTDSASAGEHGTPGGLNAHQTRSIIARLTYVDKLLDHLDDLARGGGSVFARERPDLTPDEGAMLVAFVQRARAELAGALDALGIPRPATDGSARWSAAVTLSFADMTVNELSESHLRGYGALDPAAARAVAGVVRQLSEVLAEGAALLHEHDPGGLAARLARVAGPAGSVLRILDEITTAHRLSALRPLLAAAVDRADDTLFAVGIFGRVSVGKSSLINALLRADVLPVGATPVTAVPISIERGEPSASVEYQDRDAVAIAITELAQMVTEDGNPGNRRGVRAVYVQVPTAPPGARLLDTPGVGSLASSGPAQTFAWLPRCDLGLVLVAAGTPLGRDELALVSGLANAGIACRVLVAKADLLAEDERPAAVEYVGRALGAALGPASAPEVSIVSVLAREHATLDALRCDVLEPLAYAHLERASNALARRLRSLVLAVGAALEDHGGEVAAPAASGVVAQEADAARRRVRLIADHLADAAPSVLDSAAERVAAAWSNGENGAAAARATILGAAGAALAAVRDAADAVGTSASPAGPDGAEERLPPLFDSTLLDALPRLTVPTGVPRLLRRTMAARRLGVLRPQLMSEFGRYATRITAWGGGRISRRLETLVGSAPGNGRGASSPRLPTELEDALRLVDRIAQNAAGRGEGPGA